MKPSVGRVLWYYEDRSSTPMAAIVAYVHRDNLVTVGYWDDKGVARSAVKVPLLQPDEPNLEMKEGGFCRWPTREKEPIQEAAEKGFKS